MSSFFILISILISLIVYGIYEYQSHQKNLQKIPIRIHVNGTRGKSSVTRLIGAGLRAGGYNTITKVTGTFPRLILNDGSEVAIHRKAGANILEQIDIVKFAADNNADVLLIECMALNPIYQRITEHQMIKATHGIITNVRMDHLDVMGPGLQDVANALSLTIPKSSKFFCAEARFSKFLRKKAKAQNTEFTNSLNNHVSMEDMMGFTYLEHKENVALALSICKEMGVDRELALQAMKRTHPDEGVLKKHTINYKMHPIHFYNALAANDPESSVMLWDMIQNLEGNNKKYMVLINSRKDRKERSAQLTHAVSNLHFDKLILTGENVSQVKVMAKKSGITETKILPIGQDAPSGQLEKIKSSVHSEVVIVAFGNMGAGGAELCKYFEQNKIA